MKPIKTNHDELQKIAAITEKHGIASDMLLATEAIEAIYNAVPVYYKCNKEWLEHVKEGGLLRLGYILGVRAERERKLKH